MMIQIAAPSETTHASRTNNQFTALQPKLTSFFRWLEPLGKWRESMPAQTDSAEPDAQFCRNLRRGGLFGA